MTMPLKPFMREIVRGKSISRALLFSHLAGFFQDHPAYVRPASVLELGSEPASHQRAFPRNWLIVRANMTGYPAMDINFDLEGPFPCMDGSYDGVVAFNTLYAIRNFPACIGECVRVARSFVVFNMPHVGAYAPHPRDFHRSTKESLSAILDPLRERGDIADFRIMPLGGSFTSAFSLIEPYFKWRIFRVPLGMAAVFLDRLDGMFVRECPIQHLVLIRTHMRI